MFFIELQSIMPLRWVIMYYNYYESDEFNTDNCTTKGLCSVDPTISSLQEVIVMYLKQLAFYTLRLKRKGITNNVIKENIIITLAGLVSNTDYSQEQFKNIISNIYEHLKQSKILYERIWKENNLNIDTLKTQLKIEKQLDINKAIQQGEKEFIKKNKKLTMEQRSLFEIMFVLIKNVCINLIELKSLDKENDSAYYSILHLLNLMNCEEITEKRLRTSLKHFVKTNYEITKELNKAQIEAFGDPETTEVSFSTTPNKAVLVSGSNLKELEQVLIATKDRSLDVYTHGAMILGHTFPEIKKYPQLKGQFGLGVENCLLDFATFPGAILMTKNSLHNVEYLYRGRLFTTDVNVPKGVIKIENNDYEPLITSAHEAKGFAKGQIRPTLTIGYKNKMIEKKIDEIVEKIEHQHIKHLFIVGILNHTSLQKRYFEKLLKNLPKSIYAITLSTYTPSLNTFQINSSYDFGLIYKIIEGLQERITDKKYDLTVFLTKCDKYAISNLLNLRYLNVKNIYLSHCSPMLINPTMINTFKNIFGIKTISMPREDLMSILAS